MKTAVIYARYSSDAQTEQSIEGQIRVCQQYAAQNDIVIVDQYIDRAMTGTNDKRPDFQRMMHDCKKQQWQIVLVYKLDRFSRDIYEMTVHEHTLEENGVKLVSAMENIPDAPEGIILKNLLKGMNQYYSAELSQKINRDNRESWLKGQATGGKPVYGYDVVNKKYVINEAEAQVVRELFKKYAQGYKAVALLEDLNNRGIKQKNGSPLNKNYIYRILHNERYTGVVTHQGEVYDNIFPAIISMDLWKQVSAINEENLQSPSRKKEIFDYILSGKLVCGQCKHKMMGESSTSHTGEVHYYYACLSKRRKKADCDCKRVRKKALEDFVIQIVVKMIKDYGILHRITETICRLHERQSRENTTIAALNQKILEARKAAENIVKAIEQGIINDFTKDRLSELQAEIQRLEFDINQEKQRTYSFLNVPDVEEYICSRIVGDTEDIKHRKFLINTFVREVIWYNGKVTVTFNFTDDNPPPKITKDYIEKAESEINQAVQNGDTLETGAYKLSLCPPNTNNTHPLKEKSQLRFLFLLSLKNLTTIEITIYIISIFTSNILCKHSHKLDIFTHFCGGNTVK